MDDDIKIMMSPVQLTAALSDKRLLKVNHSVTAYTVG